MSQASGSARFPNARRSRLQTRPLFLTHAHSRIAPATSQRPPLDQRPLHLLQNVYLRIYKTPNAPTYHGACPKCARQVHFKVAAGGTSQRFFKAE